ncbi:histidine utilization repressor [Aliikangiella maris]|uniref:Histidine utilization repressor n=2 Tax=Aliikangiella maris TaxID=3162458 RepID=A0ABV2BVU6_9GAMM
MKSKDTRYTQVKNFLLNGISQQTWSAGERVPSENELVELCKVSRMTARRALQELYQEGILVRIQGKGSFVAEEKQQSSLLQIRSISAEIKEQGFTHRSELICCEEQTADSSIAKALNIEPEQLCAHSQLVHFQNDQPIQLEYRWINIDAVPEYAQQDFTSVTPSEYLLSIAPVTEAEHKVEAIIGDQSIRKILELSSDEAILLLQRRTWCDDKLVSYARLYHPGNRYSLGTKFSTKT